MPKKKIEDEMTKTIRQSIIETKAQKNKDKYCIRDFSGEVFELTPDMLVKEHYFNPLEKESLSAVAECILRKYEKILSIK